MRARELIDRGRKLRLSIQETSEEISWWEGQHCLTGEMRQRIDEYRERLQEYSDTMESILAALDSLPPVEHQTLYLRYIRGLSRKEAAAELDVSVSTIVRATGRGLELLDALLKTE